MRDGLVFKPRARLLLQLGDQLIKNEIIALLELVKNAYDADASVVTIDMKKVDQKEIGQIIITDNGTGMDKKIIENVWMEPGSEHKANKFNARELSPKYDRLPLGEKGIGRFGVHKLGKKITLISRKAGKKEVYISINWERFKVSKYLEDIPITIKERKPEVFLGRETGTKIIVKNLQTDWTRGMVRDVYRGLNSLNSPFKTPDHFRIKFTIDNTDLIKGLLTLKDIKDYALYRFKCKMENDKITEFEYKFTPWPSMKKLKRKVVTIEDKFLKESKRMIDKKDNPIDPGKHKIGEITFEGLIYDRTPMILALGVQDKKGLREYLNKNGGIRVYRDGIRVYDYGEPDNDWLNLDIRRVNVPGKRISNNILIGAISLSREDSTALKEKTNREGFIENEAYHTFVKSILYVLDKLETLRQIDKDKVRIMYGPKAKSEPVIASLNDLRVVIDKNVKDDRLKNDINNYLDRIETEYSNMTEILLKSAGAGLSLSVALHEIEKIISELKKVAEKQKPSDRILKLVERLFELVEAYGQLAKGRGQKKEDLVKITNEAIFAVEYRLEAHGIKVYPKYLDYSGDTFVKCGKSLMIISILNLFDNSIWWLKYYEIKNKKIYIDIINEYPGYISILFADNGRGFTLPTEEITKPFVSAKPYGMGIGLHIAREVIDAHNGLLQFPEYGDVSLPPQFKNGAVILISLKKEK
jgi:signal transduction histidine kinase